MECFTPKAVAPTGPPPMALVPMNLPSGIGHLFGTGDIQPTSHTTSSNGPVTLSNGSDTSTNIPLGNSGNAVTTESTGSRYPSRGFEVIEGRRWYYRLVPQHESSALHQDMTPGWGLLDEHPVNTLDGWLVVCLVVLTASLPGRRYTVNKKPATLLFSAFRTYVEFYHYMLLFVESNRSFFEIILGEYAQKPHFDIDIALDDVAGIVRGPDATPGSGDDATMVRTYADGVCEALVEALIVVMAKYNIVIDPKEDILLYTSHNEAKCSYHVLLGRYCHPNNTEARMLYNEVVAVMDKDKAKWVDQSVYSPRQQFRTLGSQKLGSHRPKIHHAKWMFRGQEITHCYFETPDSIEHETLIQFEESLVSQTSSCTMLPMIGDVNNRNDLRSLTRTGTFDDYCPDLNPELARSALRTVRDYGKVTSVEFPYQLTVIKGNLLILKRLRPSRCPVCCRVHEHENPFLTVGANNNGLRSVYFHCRRAEIGTRLLVGSIVDTDPGDEDDLPQGEHSNHQVLTISTGDTPTGAMTIDLPRPEAVVTGPVGVVSGSTTVANANVNVQHRDAVSSFIQNNLVNRVNQLATQPRVSHRKGITSLDPEIARRLMMSIITKQPI